MRQKSIDHPVVSLRPTSGIFEITTCTYLASMECSLDHKGYKKIDSLCKSDRTWKSAKVVDFLNLDPKDGRFSLYKLPLPSVHDTESIDPTFPVLDSRTKAFKATAKHLEGFVVIPGALDIEQQAFWCHECLSTYNIRSSSVSNVKDLKDYPWDTLVSSGQISKDLNDMRWLTLGYHFDWNNRQYHEDKRSPIPSNLSTLGRHIATAVECYDFKSEAAIVNFYRKKSRMGGHKDDLEPDQTAPVISISMGADAIFLIGGESKETEPVPILVRSGTILIMAGASRRSVHGVSRIFPESYPPELAKIIINLSLQKRSGESNNGTSSAGPLEKDAAAGLRYLEGMRININIRQVLGHGCDSLEGFYDCN